MALLVQCSRCASSLRLPESSAGQPTQCPTCGLQFTVPTPGSPGVELTSSRTQRPVAGRRLHPVRLACYAAGAVVVLAGIIWGLGMYLEGGVRDRFAEKAKEWARLDFPKHEGEPYRHGKVAMVRAPLIMDNKVAEEGKLDDTHFDLSGSVRTDDPDEVGTVVICRYTGGKVGDYVDTSTGSAVKSAIQVQLTLRVLDLERKVQTAEHVILGDPDAVLESGFESGVGKVEGAADWVEELSEK